MPTAKTLAAAAASATYAAAAASVLAVGMADMLPSGTFRRQGGSVRALRGRGRELA